MKNTLLLFCCLCSLLAVPVYAVKVPGLYEAETIVSSQSREDRKAAVRACLGMVLVKLAGVRDVSREPALQPILDEAEKFVRQYRYHEAPVEMPALPGAASALNWRFTVKFDEENLNGSLRDLGVPVWDRERPSILVWLVVEREHRRSFAAAGDDPALLTIIHELARRRGIPILFPLLDLVEQMRIRPGDVWLDFQEPIMAASARYNADAVLTASVSSPAPGIWEGKWRSYGADGLEHEWSTETDLPEVALEEGFNDFADTLAGEFVRSAGYIPVGEIQITVGAIDSIRHYARLLAYLGSLNSVSHVHVKQVRGSEVVLALTAHGGGQTIMQTLRLGRTLEPVEDSGAHYYRLIP